MALSEYEKQRLSHCMQNNTRLQQLGIPALSLMFAKAATSRPDKNKSAQRNAEESDSDYDPSRDGDGTGEQDLIDGNAKVLILLCCAGLTCLLADAISPILLTNLCFYF